MSDHIEYKKLYDALIPLQNKIADRYMEIKQKIPPNKTALIQKMRENEYSIPKFILHIQDRQIRAYIKELKEITFRLNSIGNKIHSQY